MIRPLRTRMRRFALATAGASAVEFALISPLLIGFYFGMAETCQLMMAQRRVSHAAAAIGDLITQGGELDSKERDDIFLAGRMIMSPFQTDTMSIRITSVVRVNNANVVDWSNVSGSAFQPLTKGAVVPLSTPINDDGQSVVLTEVTYGHQSAVGYVLPGVMTLKHASELRPRRTDTVVRCERATATSPCIPV
jgi:Flp pilus assembly protein TadG